MVVFLHRQSGPVPQSQRSGHRNIYRGKMNCWIYSGSNQRADGGNDVDDNHREQLYRDDISGDIFFFATLRPEEWF